MGERGCDQTYSMYIVIQATVRNYSHDFSSSHTVAFQAWNILMFQLVKWNRNFDYSQLVSSFIVTNRAREKCWSSETEVRKQKQNYGNRSRDAREKQPIWVSALLTYDRVLRPWSQRMTLSQQCESRISWDLGLQRASLLQCLKWLLRQCGRGQRSIRWVGEPCQGQSQLF